MRRIRLGGLIHWGWQIAIHLVLIKYLVLNCLHILDKQVAFFTMLMAPGGFSRKYLLRGVLQLILITLAQHMWKGNQLCLWELMELMKG
ncbi:hypothetical protein GM30_14145 [Trabulsiella odontotermitis]|nr:hypothetical protein GM30_14145 [Trabulsiella odontotermitis]